MNAKDILTIEEYLKGYVDAERLKAKKEVFDDIDTKIYNKYKDGLDWNGQTTFRKLAEIRSKHLKEDD